MNEALVLGVDGGGSKTLVALASRDGHVAMARRGPGTNPFDAPRWRDHLRDLLGDIGPVAAGALGLAGHGEVPSVSAEQDSAVAGCLAAPHLVFNDVQLAFDGAFQRGAGVLILAGTGSMAWARNEDGDAARVGGWGAALGDEGSAHWIGARALSLTTEALDGREDGTEFADAILAELGIPAADAQAALIDWHRTREHVRSAVASLARRVDWLAARGERLAIGLMRAAAEQLCRHVEAARRRIRRPRAPWSHAGGVFASAALRGAMAERLGPPVAPILPPIGGALWRAARLAGWPADAAWTRTLATSLAAEETIT